MSLYSINDPKHWLDRAKEARALAEQIADPEAKRTMLKNADDYERLAQRTQERAARRRPQSKKIRVGPIAATRPRLARFNAGWRRRRKQQKLQSAVSAWARPAAVRDPDPALRQLRVRCGATASPQAWLGPTDLSW